MGGSAVLTLKCVVTRGGATPGVVVMYSLPSLDTLSEVITETGLGMCSGSILGGGGAVEGPY